MEDRVKLAEIIWFNKKFFLFFKTSIIGFRYTDTTFMILNEMGKLQEIHEKDLSNVTRRHFIRTNHIGLLMTTKLLSKAFDDGKCWQQSELCKAYLKELKHKRM